MPSASGRASPTPGLVRSMPREQATRSSASHGASTSVADNQA
jgi:hypothetical protein